MKITRLEINCRDVLEQQKFYKEILGLEVIKATATYFELQIGYSVLVFQESDNFTPYHIAFHVPDKVEEIAVKWLEKRVSILKFEDLEIVDFKGWDAKSIYFYDSDNNIMEFISRRNFNGETTEGFSEKSILGISEIGLSTDDIESKFQFLKENCELIIFDGSFDKFCAIGDDQGLLITINSNLKSWFPTGDKAYNSSFNLNFIQNEKVYYIQYKENELRPLESSNKNKSA
jgi:catechol-2,3-dioxygenase